MPSRRYCLLTGCCSVLAIAGVSASPTFTPSGNDFAWDTITPSPDLEYHDCYGEFKCARLEVPLDWLNETDTRTATIAMIKLPALVPDDDPAFGGSILTNPGGPSGSGVEFIPGIGKYLRTTADKPGRRHYEIISFDPRGVGRTTPRSDCFNNDILARDAHLLEARGNGPVTNGDNTIAYSLAMMDAFGQRCERATDAMAYVGTPSVARDMVEIIDRIDELRKREAAQRQGQGGSRDDDSQTRLELKRRSVALGNEAGNVPRLQYIGFSYGTVLGNYFASMFPGRVGRVILDGVCDIEDYTTGPGWLTNTVDAEELFDNFFEGCAAAGPKTCALAHDKNTSASDIRIRFDAFLARLDEKPRAFLAPSGDSIVITGNDIRSVVAMTLYKPNMLFQRLAKDLNDLISGNIGNMAQRIIDSSGMPALRDACTLNTITPKPQISEAQNAVVCSDGEDISDKGLSWWRKYVDSQVSISSLFGALWTTIRLPCSGWRIRANWQFKGPFTTPEADPSLIPGRPAAPILFMSNRLDPVTPLRAARKMAAMHPGARVVVQEALGHCAVPSARSKCTRKIIADYFESGTLPSSEVTCEVECGPWDVNCIPFDNRNDEEAAFTWFNREEPLDLRRSPLGVL